jgi:hypothetical protein
LVEVLGVQVALAELQVNMAEQAAKDAAGGPEKRRKNITHDLPLGQVSCPALPSMSMA